MVPLLKLLFFILCAFSRKATQNRNKAVPAHGAALLVVSGAPLRILREAGSLIFLTGVKRKTAAKPAAARPLKPSIDHGRPQSRGPEFGRAALAGQLPNALPGAPLQRAVRLPKA